MNFHSILFERKQDQIEEVAEIPPFFTDLNLDQIVDAVTLGAQEYNLKPLFYTSLKDIDTIYYRQEIGKDLENGMLLINIRTFAKKLRLMRRYLGLVDKLDYKRHKQGWYLEAVIIYCEAVSGLKEDLSQAELKSRGLLAFREFLESYVTSDQFTSLQEVATQIKRDLSSVKYCVIIKGGNVKVRRYESETDYTREVEAVFEKFKRGAVKDYTAKLQAGSGMNHVEAQILNLVARLFPDIFLSLDDFCTQYRNFLDETIRVFDREIQFYVTYQEFIAKIKQAGLAFCYPRVSKSDKEVCNVDGFDLALANKCIIEKTSIIWNDFYLRDQERILVVSGPNQGGKTTFARAFGQLHFLASLGCPVPGREAKLYLFDNLFTHFETEEDIRNLRGKLQDDLFRIHTILEHATSDSIIIMNEIFTSTALKDAVFLGKKIIERIIKLDMLCVCVSFIDELASMSEKTVSMVSTVVPENPALRTYKIIRKPADGLAYAVSISEKYHLTYDSLKERIKP
jgi:DNA mismatch repair protein MutS